MSFLLYSENEGQQTLNTLSLKFLGYTKLSFFNIMLRNLVENSLKKTSKNLNFHFFKNHLVGGSIC
jgi:hypothetical protein